MPNAPRRAKILTVVAGLAAAAVVAEVGLRGAGYSQPPRYRPHGLYGWMAAAGEAAEATAPGDRETPDRETPGDRETLRVAVLGDSLAEGAELAPGDRFAARLEGFLAASYPGPAGEVRVLDFSSAGYSTAQELLVLRHGALAADPDVVVLVFYAGNDVRDNLPALASEDRRPFLHLEADGSLVLDTSFRHRWPHRLRRGPLGDALYWSLARSRLLQLSLDAAMHPVRYRHRLPPQGMPRPSRDDAVYHEAPADEEWRRAWQVTGALLRQAATDSRDAGARFLLVSGSIGVQVHPDRDLRRRFAAAVGVGDLLGPERRLVELARREGFSYLALSPRLAVHAAHGGRPLHDAGGFGHWTAEGHRLAARTVAQRLCRMRPSRTPAAAEPDAG